MHEEQHGELIWIVNGDQMYPKDPEAYQALLRRENPDKAVIELEWMFELEAREQEGK